MVGSSTWLRYSERKSSEERERGGGGEGEREREREREREEREREREREREKERERESIETSLCSACCGPGRFLTIDFACEVTVGDLPIDRRREKKI